MRKHTTAILLLAAMAVQAPAASAQASLSTLCASWSNSVGREPDWYAQACLPSSIAPLARSSGNPQALGDLAYQLNNRAGSGPTFEALQSFLLPDAATATVIGPQPASIYGLAWDNATHTLWAVADVPAIGTLNTSTAAFTAAATITGLGAGELASGITFIDAASTFYLLTSNSTESYLYTLNTGTGAATLIGAMGVGSMIDIAINADGEMYGHSILTDSIYSIDTATGAATLIGPTGFAASFAQGMSFDKSTGVLYAWIYHGGGANTFATINLATGAATTVASPASGEYEGAITSAAPDDTIFEHGFESVP